jgi:hypothetical protein
MFDWHKKEKPLLGSAGLGGGIASNLVGGISGPKATGGTVVEDGGYTFHVFTSSGAFEVLQNIDIKFLIVGGGGAIYPDGQNIAYGGGGGGGGVVYNDNPQPITKSGGPYPVVVGERMGDNNPYNPEPTTDIDSTYGNPSSFNGYTAGGGGGTGGFALAGQDGGPGSTLDSRPGQGAGGGGGQGGPGSPVYPAGPHAGGSGSYSGGNGATRSPSTVLAGGGGGGAGGNGSNAPTSNGGRGGLGAAIPWVPPAYGTPGPNASARYFGGGGGGNWYPFSDGPLPSTAPLGGGGGDGIQSNDPSSPFPEAIYAKNNTGGGCGGSNGGASGIVIIRYPT